MSLQRDVVRAIFRLYSEEEAKQFLLRYYGETEEGKKEKERSPHRDRDLYEFVALIAQDAKNELNNSLYV